VKDEVLSLSAVLLFSPPMFPVLGPVLSLEAQVQKGVPSPIRPDEDVSALASIASVRPCLWLALQP